MNERNEGRQARRCGAIGHGDGSVRWRVWAPKAERVSLVLIDGAARARSPMQPEEGGYHRHEEAGVPEGRRYAFRLDDGPERPTPVRSGSPRGSTGRRPSCCRIDSPGPTGGWKGVRREDLVFYELHVGTFSPEGTFEGDHPRLRDLRELGVTAVEIMPVGQFPGDAQLGL